MCRNIFVFEFQNDKFEVVEKDKVASFKMITLEEILKKEEETQYKQTINDLYPNLFIIEEIENRNAAIKPSFRFSRLAS